jgi:hypothetical protein
MKAAYPLLSWLALCCACTDYGVNIIELPDPEPRDTAPIVDTEWVDTQVPMDSDPPLHCEDGPWPEGEAAVDETCIWQPQTGSFSPVVEWWIPEFEDFAENAISVAAPAVGQLTDDDGDGDVDSDDVPDIVTVFVDGFDSTYPGVMRAISGDGSGVHWSVGTDEVEQGRFRPLGVAPASLADFDADGLPEIAVTVTGETGYSSRDECFAALYDHSGDLIWVNTDEALYCGGNAPAWGDLDADGTPELIFGHAIYDPATGDLLGAGQDGSGSYTSYVNSGYHSFAIDLDGDGAQEVVAGSALYGPTGETLCRTGMPDGYPAAADLDGDGQGEFVVTGNGWVRIFEHDCWLITQWSLPDDGFGGPATIADYDGDGDPEIGVASHDSYYVYETDGTMLWSKNTDDSSSSATGSSVYDFDGDGYAEVVYADENDLWIFQGTNGAVRLQDTNHTSGTVHELPVIVDVDGDGEVEIIVVDSLGLYVVGDEDHSWVAGRKVWNQASYNIVNANDDLTIPAIPDPNWPDHNNFRSGDITAAFASAAPDPVPLLVDVCTLECGQDVLQIAVQVGNAGLGTLPAGISVSLYEGAEATGEPLATAVTSDEARSGGSSDTLLFVLEGAAASVEALTVAVDPDDAYTDCDERNNELIIDEGLCP